MNRVIKFGIAGTNESSRLPARDSASLKPKSSKVRSGSSHNSPRPDSADDLGPPRTDDASSTNLQHVLIKWTGSKRRLAKQIVAQFPRRIYTYYEPFLGGGSILYELLGTEIEVGRFESVRCGLLDKDDERDKVRARWRQRQAGVPREAGGPREAQRQELDHLLAQVGDRPSVTF